MKTGIAIVVALCVLLTNAFAAENVFISQVYYDPVNTEAGGEAVELYNPTDQAINLSGYKLATKGNPSDVTLPHESVIKPKEYFLIADADWNVMRDKDSWPLANHEEAMTLVNSDSGVALFSPTGIVDAVGWGAVTEATLFEATPAQHVPAGYALRRENLTDTNNNSRDFVKSLPVFHHQTKEPTKGENIGLRVNVTNADPTIEKIDVTDDDTTKEGIQVQPVPGEEKIFEVRVVARDENGFEDITSVTTFFDVHETNLTFVKNLTERDAEYRGNLSILYYYEGKEYVVKVRASDGIVSKENETSFQYLNVTAFAVDTTTLTLNATPGKNITIEGDTDFFSTTQPTIKNIGNTPLDVGVFAQALTNGKNTIPLTNIQYSFDNFKQTSTAMNDQLTLHPTHVQPGVAAFQLLGLQLLLPTTLGPGMYSGTITVVGASA